MSNLAENDLNKIVSTNIDKIKNSLCVITDLNALKSSVLKIFQYLKDNPAYISGFVDGEGCFSCYMNARTDMKLGFQIIPEINVVQSQVDVAKNKAQMTNIKEKYENSIKKK